MEALVAGTYTAAEALGVDSLVGSVEAGKRADLLVVDPDPLADIANIGQRDNIKMIVKNGAPVNFGLASSTDR